MQFKGRVEKLKIKQHAEQRAVVIELSCLVSKEQEKAIIDSFMNSAKDGIVTINETIFGKEIEFELGAK